MALYETPKPCKQLWDLRFSQLWRYTSLFCVSHG